jgi:type IV pilus assembly protein PilQ
MIPPKSLLLVFLWCCTCGILTAQAPQGITEQEEERFELIAEKLAAYAMNYPAIDQGIDITFTGSLQDFAIAFTNATRLSITVYPSVQLQVVANFSGTKPRDILLHLCRFYQLDLAVSGSILSLMPYQTAPAPRAWRSPDITYNSYNGRLKLNLQNDTLDAVVRKISQLTGINVIASNAASPKIVNGYVGDATMEDALEQMALRNELGLNKNNKQFLLIETLNEKNSNASAVPRNNATNNSPAANTTGTFITTATPLPQGLQLQTHKDSVTDIIKVSLKANAVPISELIKTVAAQTESKFYMYAEPNEVIQLQLEQVGFPELLDYLSKNAGVSYHEDKGIYLIGDQKSRGLLKTSVFQFQHRSVKGISKFIPREFAQLEVHEFVELNAMVINGISTEIEKCIDYIKKIDKSVPVVMIELLILDVQETKSVRAGVKAGVGEAPAKNGGTLFPGIDFTFSANGINSLLDILTGNGIVNLGKVKPNFYATLQAVEDNGTVKIRSKPRLSTLNGVEASLKLGETRYFLVERTTVQGNQSPISLQERRYESVNADFSVKILPIVSGDEFVTLDIRVEQSDFIGKVQANAPPPQVSRVFTSNIRILDGEMIVLGGLENKRVEDSGSGVPLLSRIPVLKWLFSNRTKSKTKSKLLVFVKPTVIY